jgi:hypothetical protein
MRPSVQDVASIGAALLPFLLRTLSNQARLSDVA